MVHQVGAPVEVDTAEWPWALTLVGRYSSCVPTAWAWLCQVCTQLEPTVFVLHSLPQDTQRRA